MVQGLGQRRGACSEFSPGIPFMWRKVEMRLACTATRLPPTPAETKDLRHGGEGRVPRRRGRHCEERQRHPPTPIPGVFRSSHPPALEMWETPAPLVWLRVQEGTQADLSTQGA